ncbi:putative pre-16S rRNA nuclease [Synergistales bacterium]|nr:putative pre-16S rRNA nuclease [Synergistales bacterium]
MKSYESSFPMPRIIALDIGTVRIGVAVSDPLISFARGLCVLRAEGEWRDELAAIMSEYGADTLLVGMPRRTDGSDGPEARAMSDIIGTLSIRFPDAEVIAWDERFTTTIATRALIEADVSRADRKKSVDKVAAVLLLQSYIDSLRGGTMNAALPVMDDAREKPRRGGRGKKAYE